MQVDVIICTYNRAGKLAAAVQSVLGARLAPEHALRVIVVDNNSNDATASVLHELEQRFPSRLLRVLETRQGKSHALNAGLLHAEAELVAFTDDDIAADRCWVAGMIEALQRNPDCSCFGGKTVALYPEHLPAWLDLDGSMGFLRSVFVDRFDGETEMEYGKGTVARTPAGVNMFFRRETLLKNGPFRTDLGPQGKQLGFSEDTEFCQRLIDRGERFIYVPAAAVYHPVHEDRLDKGYLLSWQYRCGRSEVRKKGGYGSCPRLFGVPRYLFKKGAQHLAGYCAALRGKRRFYHQLRLYYTAGEILEHLVLARGHGGSH